MPPEPSVRGQRALQVHLLIAAQRPQICPVERFLQQIERQFVLTRERNSQAAPVHRNAVTRSNLRCDFRRGYLQPRSLFGSANRQDCADLFDQTGKHADQLVAKENQRDERKDWEQHRHGPLENKSEKAGRTHTGMFGDRFHEQVWTVANIAERTEAGGG